MLYETTVPQFQKMLTSLSHLLDKAAASADQRKFDVDVLLHSRLYPDQFNFTRQVQSATDSAKLCIARLTGIEAQVHDDKEKTLGELKTRVQDVLKYIGSVKPENFKGAAEKRITNKRWEDKSLSGENYALQFALPNFYFHVTTAYAILRHNGVEIGKKDYMGELPFNK